ncbi:extracellular solute-binding protein [Paenibacillus sp. 1P07SE]|uniref:extracellular solute-binding protein n=1 Tax=Paenibacillus sp. 1P07SE TaxID=3132209 RepID=UPI0039A64E1B
MKKKTSMLALTLGVSLAVTGCSGGSTPANTPGSEGTNTPPPESSNADLKMIMQYSRFDPNTDYTANYISEKTGFNITYEMLPAENADEKLNLMVANRENFDLMKLNAAQFYNLATAGALEPLDELIEAHGNHIQNAIKPESWGSATINDQIFALPETGAGVSIGEELVIRQDWMEELSLEMPTTTDELYDVLVAIRDAKNIVPLTGSNDSIYGDIAAAFGVLTEWKEVDGELKHRAELPEMKDFLEYMNKLYSEGLLDTEMPINTAAKAIEKFSSGRAGVYKLAWWNAGNTISALTDNHPDATVTPIPYLKNQDGNAEIGVLANTTWFIAIPKSSKNKEDAMKLLNAKLEPETFKGMAIGEEGVHHEVKDGKYFPILPKFNDDLNNASAFMTAVDEENYPTFWQARVRKDPILQSYYEQFQANAEGIIVVDPMSLAPPIEAVSKNTLKLNKLLDDNVLKFIAGSEPIANYDQFLAQWHAEGGQEMVAAANEWFATSGQ